MEKSTSAKTPNSSSSITQSNPMETFNTFVHSSMLIIGNRLTGRNFLEWAESIKLPIDGRRKLDYLTGKVKVMKKGDEGFNEKRSENSLVTSWLLNSLEASIAKPHMFMKMAKKI